MPAEVEAVDCKEAIDAKCHPKCASAWEVYKKCEARIEEKVGRMPTLAGADCALAGVFTRSGSPHDNPTPCAGPGSVQWFLHGLLQMHRSLRGKVHVQATRVIASVSMASLGEGVFCHDS